MSTKITRRGFLKRSAVGVGGLVLAVPPVQTLGNILASLNRRMPWYRTGEIKTTYNYCDICP